MHQGFCAGPASPAASPTSSTTTAVASRRYLCAAIALVHGCRRPLRRRGFPTRREAQAALTELLASLQRSTFVKPERLTVGDYLHGWMDALEFSGRAEATVSSYRHTLRLHVIPRLGEGRPATTGSPVRARHRVGRFQRRGGKGSSRPEPDVGRYAARRGGRRAPGAGRRAPKVSWWRPEELQAFLVFVEDHELGTLLRELASGGGEIVLKRWLARQPRAATVAELQAQLDRFGDYYDNHRPDRALSRRTPAQAFAARIRATPKLAPPSLPTDTTGCGGTASTRPAV